jgi:hypothetical protein
LNKKIDYLGASYDNALPSVTYRSKQKLSEVQTGVKLHKGKNSLIGPDLSKAHMW